MNFGKTAYLKITEIEKNLNFENQQSQQSSQNSFLEFNKPNIDQYFSNQHCIINFPNLELSENSEICFQIKFTISSQTDDTITTHLFLDNFEIFNEQSSVKAGENEFVTMKTFSSISKTNSSLKIDFENIASENQIKVSNIKMIVMGLANTTNDNSIFMNALTFGGNVLVSFVDSQTLYYQICELSPQNIDQSKFASLGTCNSHCFMKSSETQTTKNELYLLFVDEDSNLKLKTPFNQEQDKTIDTNVSFVSGTFFERQKLNLVIFIKNGELFFVTIKEGHISNQQKLTKLKANFKEVQIATSSDSEKLFVIATTENNSAYIFNSIIETDTSDEVETIKASYAVSVVKYIDMELADNLSVETIKMNTNLLVSPLVLFNSFISENSISSLHCKMDFRSSPKENADATIYGVKLDKSNPIGATWATYIDDAVDFSPAYMDFENDVFVDNGWNSRWPFSEIRPCLYDRTNLKVIGYLDKNNFEVFEDQTQANISDDSSAVVMIEFPRIYYKISCDDNFNYIQICDKKIDGFESLAFDIKDIESDHIYITAYPGPDMQYSSSNKAYHFYSGAEINIHTTSLYSTNNPSLQYANHFMVLTYPAFTLVGCLFAIMFKSTDARNSLGVGFTTPCEHYYTGELNKKGMNYGSSTSGHTKLFGMEDFYGLSQTIGCGMHYKKNKNAYSYVDPKSNAFYLFTHTANFANFGENLPPPHEDPGKTVPVTLSGDTRTGFFGSIEDNVSDITKGFCDYSYMSIPSDNTCNVYGNLSGGGGLYASHTRTYSSTTPAIIRLMRMENY